MDLLTIAERTGAIAAKPVKAEQPAGKMLFIAPAADALPEDGVFEYATIEKFFDLANMPERTVVLFDVRQERMLQVLCEQRVLLDLELRVLAGLPSAHYMPWFENATFGVERVAYAPFLAEVSMQQEVARQTAASAPKSVSEREDERIVRADGSIRSHDSIRVGADLSSDGEVE